MLISWSNLPARRRAASRESGRLVAPITMTGLLSVLSQDISEEAGEESGNGRDFHGKRTVHTGKELSDNSSLHLALRAFAFWGDSIDFVDEQQAWGYPLE